EPEKDGANRKNPVSVSFPLVGGKSVSTTANGKPKILVFYATSCGRTKNFLKNINSEYGNFGAVDISFVETRKAKESAVKSFRNKYALPEMNFAYDTSKNAKNAMDTYAKTFLPKVKTVNTPMIVYIDANNNVQEVGHGKALTSKQFWETIDKLLLNR
ncbi:MAG: redoxin domain-containing protein, partial [Treponema sp.]|nr:redoxin domain-containing protein [Treponema sp.]